MNGNEEKMAQQADFIARNGIYRSCPLCGNESADIKHSIYSKEPWIIKMCAQCNVLQKILRILRSGAHLFIKVLNYGCLNRIVMGKKWCGFRYPDHVNYWTPGTLIKIIRDTGFQIVRFNIWDRFSTSDNM
jgi:hypothetical protein